MAGLNGEGQPWKVGDLFRISCDAPNVGTDVGVVFAVRRASSGYVFFIDTEGDKRGCPFRWIEPVHKVTTVEPLVVEPAPGEWIGFNGGECPVDGDVRCEVMDSDGDKFAADVYEDWSCVVAYRIAEPAKPREWWIDPDNLEVYETPFTPFLVHVREVTE